VISFLTFISLSLFTSLGQSYDGWVIQISLVNATLYKAVTICTSTAKKQSKYNINKHFSTSFSIFGWKKTQPICDFGGTFINLSPFAFLGQSDDELG
jgi:hypothetical protein